MKTLKILIFTLLIISCNPRNVDISTLPNDWVSLTELNGELVIYESCDEGNRLLKIINNDMILLHGTQEDYEFEIKNIEKSKNDTIKINSVWKSSTVEVNYKFYWKDKENELVVWKIEEKQNMGVNGLFISKNKSEKYKTIKQPCIECWSEEECDMMQNKK